MDMKKDDIKTMLGKSTMQVANLAKLNQDLVGFITKHQEYFENQDNAFEEIARLLLTSKESISNQLSIAEFIGKHFKDQKD